MNDNLDNPELEKPGSDIPEEPSEPATDETEVSKAAGYSVLSGFQTVLSVAIIVATLLTLWNPRKLLQTPNINALIRSQLNQLEPTPAVEESTLDHIGILAGHWQDNPGEVCADGLVEADVNQAIAARSAELLRGLGYKVDVFPEFDLNYLNYHSAVFIAIYSGSCAESPLPPSGFKVATSLTAQNPETVYQLAVCLSEQYQKKTGLPFAYEVLNPDNPSNHIFRDINATTPAALIETGSLKTDRTLLVGKSDQVAEGIVSGILCFLDWQKSSQDN